jgi:hypothetical protein
MKVTNVSRRLFRRWPSEDRYHTVVSQLLALLQQLLIAAFLLSGWQHNLAALIVWAVVSLVYCIFVQSQMVVELPTHRGLRRLIREIEVLACMGTAALIVFLSGSVVNLAVIFGVYIIGGALTFELHGPKRRWLQFD